MKSPLSYSILLIALLLAACSPAAAPKTAAPPTAQPATPTALPPATHTAAAAPTMQPSATHSAAPAPQAVEYDLGEAVVVQQRFPEDSRFRNMPVRLHGLIAAPAGPGPHPVVLVFHGNHNGCPIPAGDEVDRWPCDPALEQPNYRGFGYLIEALAGQGFVALSVNINAENTLGFGEPVAGERLSQIVAKHLTALAQANDGSPAFGIDLAGRVDLRYTALIGHSRGGEEAWRLSNDAVFWGAANMPPPRGVLLIAPSVVFGPIAAPASPTAILLPACDADVFHGDGQLFYETARHDPRPGAWVTSVWLEQANHNYFNSILEDERMGRPDRPDCETLLDPGVQRGFLIDYAKDFLAAVFTPDPLTAAEAKARLGLDPGAPAPSELYGLAARISSLAAPESRRTLLIPKSEAELSANLLGGAVTAEGVKTHFCEEGYFLPSARPGADACLRVNLVVPGNPAMLVIVWGQAGAELRFTLPEAESFISGSAITLRVALDPLSTLNPAGQTQGFSLRLTDASGATALVSTRPDEPALAFPAGVAQENDFFAGGLFSGRVPLTALRFPLAAFTGLDLASIREVALVFDQTPAGALLLADLEIVR